MNDQLRAYLLTLQDVHDGSRAVDQGGRQPAAAREREAVMRVRACRALAATHGGLSVRTRANTARVLLHVPAAPTHAPRSARAQTGCGRSAPRCASGSASSQRRATPGQPCAPCASHKASSRQSTAAARTPQTQWQSRRLSTSLDPARQMRDEVLQRLERRQNGNCRSTQARYHTSSSMITSELLVAWLSSSDSSRHSTRNVDALASAASPLPMRVKMRSMGRNDANSAAT
jgi:hypothetical protein